MAFEGFLTFFSMSATLFTLKTALNAYASSSDRASPCAKLSNVKKPQRSKTFAHTGEHKNAYGQYAFCAENIKAKESVNYTCLGVQALHR